MMVNMGLSEQWFENGGPHTSRGTLEYCRGYSENCSIVCAMEGGVQPKNYSGGGALVEEV